MSNASSVPAASGVFLNLHHLRYFREIALSGNLTRAAQRLRISPGALSIQLRQLEESLEHSLFTRSKAGMSLTEAGRLVLEYAETIHRAGTEMLDVLKNQPVEGRQILRIGAVATLSRNFLLEFLRPSLNRADVEVVVRSGSLRDLVVSMHAHQVDLVLSNQAMRRDAESTWHSHLLARRPVSMVGAPRWKKRCKRFPQSLAEVPLILPSLESSTRVDFDRLVAAAGVRPLIMAEVDDMPTLRLLAREADALTLVPPVVVRDEIERGQLCEIHRIPSLFETFYAVAPSRRFPNPLVNEMVAALSKGAGKARAR